MDVCDAFCGAGGFSAGAVAAGCRVVVGIDSDATPLKLWAANTGGRAVRATIGVDAIDWPEPRQGLHVHLSPACVNLSKARSGSATKGEVGDALKMVRFCIELVLQRGYSSWSLENVSTPAVVKLLNELATLHAGTVAYVVVDAADYGTASSRTRLIAAPPSCIKRLLEQPTRRVSVAAAFATTGLPLPAQYIRSCTTNRDGTRCVRSVQEPAFCVTASHPLTWCDRGGVTVRCLTAKESAVLMSFPPDWKLPKGSRDGQRAVGNAVPPKLSEAVMLAALGETVPADAGQAVAAQPQSATAATAATALAPPIAALAAPPGEEGRTSKKLRRLEKRVAVLERLALSRLDDTPRS